MVGTLSAAIPSLGGVGAEVTAVPRERDFKRLVRLRMRKTGESYTGARRQLLGRSAAARPASTRGITMYSFDRFTEPAKTALALAQEEAAAFGGGYIGTEHLLLGLLRTPESAAGRVLNALGITQRQARKSIVARLSDVEPAMVGQIRPDDGSRRALDLAARESEHAGGGSVGTEHLLLGILGADGAGAHVLAELGVTAERARARVAAEEPEPPTFPTRRSLVPQVPPLGMPATPEVMAVLAAARSSAQVESAPLLRGDHLLATIVRANGELPYLVALLATVGTDLTALRRKLRPPRQVTRLERAISDVVSQQADAVSRADFEEDARLRKRERELRDQLAKALTTWEDGRARSG
jgi:ATP-dependent Clp protease ATP-binding subunit ClpA